MSFAIPIDTVRDIVSDLCAHGRVIRPYLGIAMSEMTPLQMRQLHQKHPAFPSHVKSGVLVRRVQQGSPAHVAGLQPGDIIGGFSGEREISDRLRQHIGRSMQVQVVRGTATGACETLQLAVTPTEQGS